MGTHHSPENYPRNFLWGEPGPEVDGARVSDKKALKDKRLAKVVIRISFSLPKIGTHICR